MDSKNVPKSAAAASAVIVVAGSMVWFWRHRVHHSRRLKRPYEVKEDASEVEDPKAEMNTIISWLQGEVLKPLDERLPGRPFEQDFLKFPCTPMVLVIGNHSAGKSTFINNMLGLSAQETAVAPTDDGFTVLERHPTKSEHEDGPTLLGCPENRPFKDLQRFGQAFWGHLKRKRLVMDSNSRMPLGLQIVDTPGMIDMPVGEGGGRGYNFLEVVRWFAKRADLILLLFDPEKPGTTRETLDVLTHSLAGLDHKFMILLNKVDSVKNSIDFARAYGTLGWALSKVILRKDLPMIYSMFNEGVHSSAGAAQRPADNWSELALESFRRKREEVEAEVCNAKKRHWDNVITTFEQMLREGEMISIVTTRIKQQISVWRIKVQSAGISFFTLPALVATRVVLTSSLQPSRRDLTVAVAAYASLCGVAACFVGDYLRQGEVFQINLDEQFEQAYKEQFIHREVEDLRVRWLTVKPKIANMLRSVSTAAQFSYVADWEVEKLKEALTTDIPYLRQLARCLQKKGS